MKKNKMMKGIVGRLRSRAGESLAEALAAILVFTLASVILFSFISTAADLNRAAKENDGVIETELLTAEKKAAGTEESGSFSVTFSVKNGKDTVILETDAVKLFRADGTALYSYSYIPPSAD